ncbi:MAG: exodeoxyribonuclease VII large subunit [Betaproteobacteria bacterium TMED82]|nr:MAG: exodeoxyribonuclease VII large subunit [Betaproteobacteria bacterium TMED82]|tara:strand:+ start:68 stop:1252 length:1185 start_codon:yes stop_codon:yes gene_type:complete
MDKISVSKLNYVMNKNLNLNFPQIVISGEVFKVNKNEDGTIFFSIKDKISSVDCVFFKDNSVWFERLKRGCSVVVRASPQIYELKGNFQLRVFAILEVSRVESTDSLNKKKIRLEKEGIFADGKKNKIPETFSNIGIVTSSRGAAVFDVVRVFSEELSDVGITIFSSKVQGSGALDSLISALEKADRDEKVEVILLVRGGGTNEDLSVFDEERLVRLISRLTKPVITGIGHENDRSLSDLASDYVGSTPTAAAHILVNQRAQLLGKLAFLKTKLVEHLRRIEFEMSKKILGYQAFLTLSDKLITLYSSKLRFSKAHLRATYSEKVFSLTAHLENLKRLIVTNEQRKIKIASYPLILEKSKSQPVESVNRLKVNDELVLKFNFGSATVKVIKVIK